MDRRDARLVKCLGMAGKFDWKIQVEDFEGLRKDAGADADTRKILRERGS
ncbi:MAG: hypothetical protein V1744_05430 [Candidatus Altiarchaeota archaeon]